MMKGDGIPQGVRIQEQPVLVEDVTPTLLDLVGVQPPTTLTGFSQTSCWTDAGCQSRLEWYAFGAKSHLQKITAVASYRWPFKLIYRPKQKRRSGLYNLFDDPWEERDLRRSMRSAGSRAQIDLKRYGERVQQRHRTLQEKIESVVSFSSVK